MKTAVLSLLALLGAAHAKYQPAAPVAKRQIQHPARGVPHSNNWARRDDELQQVTMTLVNKMSTPISTSVVSNADVLPLATGGASLVGTLDPEATAEFVAPLGWSGNIAVVGDGVPIVGNTFSSLVEFGLTEQGGINKYDVDASYVNGYSVSVTCRCDDGSDTFLSGCPTDLWTEGECGEEGETDWKEDWGSCQNPYRDYGSHDGDEASPFFQPCQHKAYTYWDDDTANSNGVCTTGKATCCIGTEEDGC